MKFVLAAIGALVAAHLAAAAETNMHFGRMTGMQIAPTGSGLGIRVTGAYFAGHVFTVNALLTLPDQTRTWYIVGSEHGIVSLTDNVPPSAWPASDALPVLLATITPVAAVDVPNYQLAQSDGHSVAYAFNEFFVPIRPGSLTVKLDGVAIGGDDGDGKLGGPALAGGTIDYAKGDISVTLKAAPSQSAFITTAFTYLPRNVHPSWLTLYPPVDNPAAQARKAAYDSGSYRIPGKDFPVGLPAAIAPADLPDLAAHPFGCDAVQGQLYRVASSHRTYEGFRLTDRTMYFASAGEGAVLRAIDDGDGHVALAGFPTGQYFDPENLTARLSDGTALGSGTGNCYSNLTSLAVPAGVPFRQQAVSVTGGGTRDNTIRQAYLDAGNQTFAIQDNTVAATNGQAMPGKLTIEKSTLTWSHPTNLATGGGQGVAYSGPVTGRNVGIENFGVCIAPFNHNDWEYVDLRHCGMGEGAHGAGVNIFGGFNDRTVDGFTGWSRMRHFRITMPAWSSPGFDGTETTALLAFETNGSRNAGVTDIEFADGLLDGGGFAIVINSTAPADHSPIRRVALHDLWISNRHEFQGASCGAQTGPINFHRPPNEFGPVLIWNIFDADTGEVLDYLTGSWSSNKKGCAIRSPLPETDLNGASIVAIRR